MDGIAGLFTGNVYPWPAESVTVPCVVVGYATVAYDLSMGRGADTWTVPVWYVVGKTGTTDARDSLSAAETVVKAAIDGGHSFGDARVTGAEATEIVISSVTYLAAKFDIEVYG
jgi:hypothetical protein